MEELLICARICAALMADDIPPDGFTEQCLCVEAVPVEMLPPLPITLKIRNDSDAKDPEPKTDDRPTLQYLESE